jgi:hypothetical protein
MPDASVHAGRPHTHEYLVVTDLRRVNVPEFKDIR